jgi:hypothetical protein
MRPALEIAASPTFFTLSHVHNYLLEFARLIPNDIWVTLPTLPIAPEQER